MSSVSQEIREFVTLAIRSGGWMALDRVYLENKLLELVGEDALTTVASHESTRSARELVERLIQQAVENQVILAAEKPLLAARIMDLMTPPPSVVNAYFAQFYAQAPERATNYFYQLCQENQTIQLQKTVGSCVKTAYGTLEIANETNELPKERQRSAYPRCSLCMENEGYSGKNAHRIIRMNLDGESWGFQYEPVMTYEEAFVIFSEEHRLMKMTRATFQRLLKIVEVLPHYFVGAVGDEMLTHEHYQGGRHAFPLARATVKTSIQLKDFPHLETEILSWWLPVIRLRSNSPVDLIAASEQLFTKWGKISDNHRITAIARRRDALFELDLVLEKGHGAPFMEILGRFSDKNNSVQKLENRISVEEAADFEAFVHSL